MNKLLQNGLISAAGVYGLWKLNRYWVGRRNSINYADRVVLITGGSRGLGLVMARQLAAEGARLALCARDQAELDAAAAELRSQGAEVVTYACDLTESDSISELVAFVESRLGPVEILINNAGTIQVGPADTMNDEDIEDALKLHLWAPIRAVHAVLPEMQKRSFGRIVNIASIGGELSVPHLLPYCISKFALVGYSRGIQCELARQGIFVTTICPGLMRTGSHLHAWFKGQHRNEFSWFSISGALPLLSMNAERAARQVLEACRQGRSHLTLGLPAKAAVLLDAISPELMAEAMSLTAYFLPQNGGENELGVEGSDSFSSWSPSWLTKLSDEAAQRNNEMH